MSNIILIGPIASGKSTIAELIGKSLGRSAFDVDRLRDEFYPKYGFDAALSSEMQRKGIMSWYEYQKPFELKIAIDVMKKKRNSVLAFGGGHSVYSSQDDFLELKAEARNHKVILLLPSTNHVENLEELSNRKPNVPRELNKIFLENTSNEKLANFTVYTRGKSPKEVGEEILKKLEET